MRCLTSTWLRIGCQQRAANRASRLGIAEVVYGDRKTARATRARARRCHPPRRRGPVARRCSPESNCARTHSEPLRPPTTQASASAGFRAPITALSRIGFADDSTLDAAWTRQRASPEHKPSSNAGHLDAGHLDAGRHCRARRGLHARVGSHGRSGADASERGAPRARAGEPSPDFNTAAAVAEG